MKQLIYNGEIYEADRIVKGIDYIIGYVGDQEIFSFRGVSDFTKFQVDGTFDAPETAEIDALKAQVEAMQKAIDDMILGGTV